MSRPSVHLLAFAAVAALCRAADPTPEQTAFFEDKIRPVLADKCYKCHSEKAEKIKGGLLLDSREAVLKGGDNGPILDGTDPAKSSLIAALRWLDKDLKMPPKEQLPAAVVRDFEEWVKMGAPDPRTGAVAVAKKEGPTFDFAKERQRWPFNPPVRPAVPSLPLPLPLPLTLTRTPTPTAEQSERERERKSERNPIDAFIAAKLAEKHLAPAPPAGKRTLIRRATYDLTGLPPTPAEIDAFLTDEESDAFAKVVDRLLASPAYGEKWARHWLDVVRYVDGYGEGNANKDVTDAWRYRDWVVDSFNHDLPYDEFVRQQIAGDLLPAPDGSAFNRDGLIATSVLMFGEWGRNDADLDKVYTDIVDDQLDVIGKGFLGLTVTCARCHDHKFDPIPTSDYYSLAGIFFSSHVLPKPGSKVNAPEVLHVPLLPPAELVARRAEEKRIAALESKIAGVIQGRNGELAKTLWPRTTEYLMAAWSYANRPPERFAEPLAEFAKAKNIEVFALRQWLDFLRLADERFLNVPVVDYGGKAGILAWTVLPRIDSAEGKARVELNTKPESLSALIVNPTGETASFSKFTLPARTIALHSASTKGAVVAWRAPIDATIRIDGELEDAVSDCDVDVEWKLDHLDRNGRTTLAHGTVPNAMSQKISASEGAEKVASVEVKTGDLIELVVLPKQADSCRVTKLDLQIINAAAGEEQKWNLSDDLLADLHENGAGNPHSDRFQHDDVWHFLDREIDTMPIDKFYGPYGFFSAMEMARKSKGKDFTAQLTDAANTVQGLLVNNSAELERLMRNPSEFFGSKLANSGSVQFYRQFTTTLSPFFNHAFSEASLAPEQRAELNALRGELAHAKKKLPPLPTANAIAEGGVPGSPHDGFHDAHIHKRGKYDALGEVVPRRFPRVLAGDTQPQIGANESGRAQLAKWLGSKENPLLARVMMNRIWQGHFGEGIVRTPNNFGKMGAPPTHPELLDWLACEFMERGFSIKAMHREIMLSAAYQQSSAPSRETLAADPDNQLFGWFPRRRLTAEELRDSILSASAAIDRKAGGPADKDKEASRRRTLYVSQARSDARSFRALFDAPDPSTPAERRGDSIVAPQALYLLNDKFVIEQSEALALRAAAFGSDDAARIAALYSALYARPAADRELTLTQSLLAKWRLRPAPKDLSPDEAAWRNLCQVLLCSNEFVFID